MTRRGWSLFVALGIIWGLPYLLIRVSVREVSPAFLVLVRTGGAALLLVPIAAARGQLAPALRRWRPLLAYTVAELAIPWLLLFTAEKHISSSLSGLLIGTVPLFAAALAFATGSDRVDARRLVGLLAGIAGVAAIVGFDLHGPQLVYVAALFVTALGYALGPWILAHHLAVVPPLGAVSVSFLFCALLYSPAVAFSLPAHLPSASVRWSLVGLTLVCTVGAFLILPALIAEVGAMRTTLVTYVNPAVAVLLGVAVLGERFSAVTAVGFLLIVGGCLLASRPAALGSGPTLPPALPES